MATSRSVPQTAEVGQDDLRRFRTDVYDCLTGRADGLFELLDGLCSPVPVAGVAHVTLAAGSRRGHGSAYAALSRGEIDVDMLGDVLAAHRPAGWRPDFAVDATTWARCDAECSPGRGFYYHPSRHSAGQPIVAGWCYLWVVGLSASADSWTAPLHAHRLAVPDNLNTVAVARVRALLPRLEPGPLTPLFAFDAGFDPVQLSVGLSDVDAQIVVRIRDDRKFFTPPPPRRPGRGGRPRRHGDRFSCADPSTWPAPDRDRTPKTLWLWWTGPPASTADLDRIWRAYIRRFDIEHTIRFAKQTLGATTPKIRTPAQADRWTWLILAALTQLRLARDHVADHRLPWQPPLPVDKMTPGRVRAGFAHLLPRLNNPTNWPKPSRPGPGRPKGRKSTPATRHPAAKKTNTKIHQQAKRR